MAYSATPLFLRLGVNLKSYPLFSMSISNIKKKSNDPIGILVCKICLFLLLFFSTFCIV